MVKVMVKLVTKNVLLILVGLLSLTALCGCGTYGSRFKSPPAKGIYHLMLSEIDEKISSGESEEVYKVSRNRRGYRGSGKYEEVPEFKVDIDDEFLIIEE